MGNEFSSPSFCEAPDDKLSQRPGHRAPTSSWQWSLLRSSRGLGKRWGWRGVQHVGKAPSIYLSICLSVCLSICLFVCLSVCLSAYHIYIYTYVCESRFTCLIDVYCELKWVRPILVSFLEFFAMVSLVVISGGMPWPHVFGCFWQDCLDTHCRPPQEFSGLNTL